MIKLQMEERAGGRVARMTVSNPAKLNILKPAALEGIVDGMRKAQAEDGLRAVVLTGAGDKAFVGGADLETLERLDPATARAFISRVHAACRALRECPVPVLARINGWCLGAGLELAACCDLRIAAAGARFGMPEVRLGIPSVVEAAVLPRLVGAGRARWLVMTGETIDAPTALAWGLVEQVSAPGALDADVERTLDALLAADPEALREQKALCHRWEEAPLADSVRESIDAFARCYEQGVPNKRVAAFRAARRKP